MNAYTRTALDLATALSCKPRAAQTVHICLRKYSGSSSPRYVVLVTPAGRAGDYYEVYSPALSALQAGMTPEELELEPLDDPEPEPLDYPVADREASRADALYQARKEAL